MLTITLTALTGLLWLQAGVLHFERMVQSASTEDAIIWTVTDISLPARLARCTIFCLFLATWPAFLLVCAWRARHQA